MIEGTKIWKASDLRKNVVDLESISLEVTQEKRMKNILRRTSMESCVHALVKIILDSQIDWYQKKEATYRPTPISGKSF